MGLGLGAGRWLKLSTGAGVGGAAMLLSLSDLPNHHHIPPSPISMHTAATHSPPSVIIIKPPIIATSLPGCHLNSLPLPPCQHWVSAFASPPPRSSSWFPPWLAAHFPNWDAQIVPLAMLLPRGDTLGCHTIVPLSRHLMPCQHQVCACITPPPRSSSSSSWFPSWLAARFPNWDARIIPLANVVPEPTECFHTWHPPAEAPPLPPPSGQKKRPVIAAVLLGWLGAQHKHLRVYADWYNARGFYALTFTLPISQILTSLKPGGKAEQHVQNLATHLSLWLQEGAAVGEERLLIFHTFSNTGWLSYGVVLEKMMREQDNNLLDNIKGCVVDSAPSAELNPQVWASGFSAALLKKSSVATRGALEWDKRNLSHLNAQQIQPQPTEMAILAMLENFFAFFLNLPTVKRRLSEVISILSKQQPDYPQLYLYSGADKVIPAESIELFIEQQKKAGRKVRSCNMQWSPHVDHFRTFPEVYSSQLASFLNECVPP